jgi:hypothetical protein
MEFYSKRYHLFRAIHYSVILCNLACYVSVADILSGLRAWREHADFEVWSKPK